VELRTFLKKPTQAVKTDYTVFISILGCFLSLSIGGAAHRKNQHGDQAATRIAIILTKQERNERGNLWENK